MTSPPADLEDAPTVAMGVSDVRRRLITAALLVGTFLASLEVVVVSPAMPAVVSDFGGAGLYPWVFTTYIVAQTVSMPLYGVLADRWGRRDTYLLGVGLFLAGSTACALAPSMELLVAARLLQGLGAGALIPLTMTLFGDLYPVEERTRMQGYFSLIWGVSSLLGPLVGGFLTDAVGWRAIFWLNLPPGLAATAIVGLAVPRRLGLVDVSLEAPRTSWLSLLRSPAQQAIYGSGVLFGAVLIGVISFLPVWVQAVQGGSATDAGIALIPMSLSWTVAANVCGRLVGRQGFRRLVRLGAILVGLGTALAALTPASALGLMVFGTGMGFLISTFNVAAQEDAALELKGVATSMTVFSRSVGAAVEVPLLGLLAGLDPAASEFSDVTDLRQGMERVWVALALWGALGALAVFLRFPERVGSPGRSTTGRSEEALARPGAQG